MAFGTILVAGASVTAGVLLVQVAVIPLLFRYSKFIQRKIVFSNCINYPSNLDYDDPVICNVYGVRNFKVEFDSNIDNRRIKLGAWHLLPRSQFRDVFLIRDEIMDKRMVELLRNTTNTVVLYCHGNSNHRASSHRIQMYQVFQDLNFHVITFDYRGYGDSTGVRPTERGVVEDTLQMYSWLQKAVNPDVRPTVLLWGHSLGASVAANLVANLDVLCQVSNLDALAQPDAIVLESPFNNLMEEIERHPFSKIVSWLPYYRRVFMEPFSSSSEFAFTTDRYLQTVPLLPVLILHAMGDRIVPYQLAVKLHDAAAESRSHLEESGLLILHAFDKGKGLGHNNLCQADDLKTVVRNFLKGMKSKLSIYQSKENTKFFLSAK